MDIVNDKKQKKYVQIFDEIVSVISST